MSSWITNGLKNLRVRVGGAVGSISQPRLYGDQAKHVQVPPKPKKPMTPYFRFLGEVRGAVQRDNPDAKGKELVKLVAGRWRKLDEGSKQPYLDAYKTEMKSFAAILNKYRDSLTPEQIDAEQQLKFEKQLEKEKREKKKRLKELGKPKKPPSPYFKYVFDKIAPGSPIGEYTTMAKSLSGKWKTLSDAEKGPYVEKYQEDLRNYERALTRWEDKMIKQGNDDLVRESRRSKGRALSRVK